MGRGGTRRGGRRRRNIEGMDKKGLDIGDGTFPFYPLFLVIFQKMDGEERVSVQSVQSFQYLYIHS